MIAFAIPAHNERRLIGATIDSIRTAAERLALRCDIVVCDDGSDDGTAGVARGHGARVVRIESRHIAAARNAAAHAALADHAVDTLIFVDADTRVTPDAVKEAIHALNTGAVAGGAPIMFDGPVPRWARVTLVITQFFFRRFKLSGGCFIYCTRAAFDAAGGWDETVYAGEEIRFAMAMKNLGRFVIIRSPVITSGRKLRAHSGPEIFATIMRLAVRGSGAVRSRDGLDLWYGPRRPDPLDARPLTRHAAPPGSGDTRSSSAPAQRPGPPADPRTPPRQTP